MKTFLKQTLLMRTVCAPPADVGDSQMYGYEEAGTLWLWCWPKLLGWPHEITWLFSPVVRNKTWPGDLWGVDVAGNLLIVETKAAIGKTGSDPFQDFVGYTIPPLEQLLKNINKRWLKLAACERAFVSEHASALIQETLALRCYRGVVPYSRQRREVRRWRHMYVENLLPLFSTEDYELRVQENLRMYEQAGGPSPHYFALFTLLNGAKPVLSDVGLSHYKQLEQSVGSSHLHMVAVEAREAQEGIVEIVSHGLAIAGD